MNTKSQSDRERAERYRTRLEAELAETEALVAANAGNSAPVQLDQQSVGRLARMDAMQVQAMAQEAERRRKDRVLRIRGALQRIEEGEFGYCAECGEEIAEGRLDIDPTFHLCVKCAR
ncbi:TraR/DksA family transcriptional regulator [Microvirga sp. GCM10011540]|uniref:TraR/DksA family transcriptional regulator n=1 Tax=Microvirga sp. GCM10011540 TaxID=3317338 RepID=UPI00360D43B4